MPTVQSNYNRFLSPGLEGDIADTANRLLVSKTLSGTAPLPFGRAVALTTDDNACRVVAAGDAIANMYGVSVLDRSVNDVATTNTGATGELGQFAIGDSVRIMMRGAIWLRAVAAVAPGDPIHIILATATFSNAGGIAIAGRWETTAAAGALAVARIDGFNAP